MLQFLHVSFIALRFLLLSSVFFVFNLRFLAIEITKVNFGCKYAKISMFCYITVIQQYTQQKKRIAVSSYCNQVLIRM